MLKLASSVPLLSRLSKVELAKLVPDLRERMLLPGESVTEGGFENCVHLVVSGQVELVNGDHSLVIWSSGEIINTEDLPHGDSNQWMIQALTDVELVSISTERFRQLIETNQDVSRHLRTVTTQRMSLLLSELSRTRLVLSEYAQELWQNVPDGPQSFPVAASVLVTPQVEISTRAHLPKRTLSISWPKAVAIAGSVLGLLIGLLGGGGLHHASMTLGILVIAAANWLAGLIPDFAVALGISMAAILLNLAKPAVALSGFISPTWFVLLAVWGISVAVNKSGLLYRLALGMLKVLPPTYLGQSMAMALTGLITTPFLPSGQSRVAMVAPLVKELADAMRYKNNSRGMAALGMSSLIGFGLMYFMFLNGSTLPLLAYSLLPADAHPKITWLLWFVAALPLGLFVFVASYAGIYKLLPPEPSPLVPREVIQSQLRVLGPMSKAEWITAGVLFVTLGAFSLGSIWHFEPAWVSMVCMLVLVGFNILDRESLKRSVDWGFLLFFGAVLSFAAVARDNGVDVMISGLIIPIFRMAKGSPAAFVLGVTAITFAVRLVIPAVQSVPLLLIALTPVATAMNVHPFVVSLVVLTMGTNFVIPQQSPFYMALHAGTDEAFTHRQIMGVAVMHAFVMAVGLLGSVPWWRHLGLIP